MTTDPLSPMSSSFIRHVRSALINDRKDMLSRVRDGAHNGADEDTIQIFIDGQTAHILRKIEAAALLYLEQIYMKSLNRVIGEISLLTPGIPAYITQADRAKIEDEVVYTMWRVKAVLIDRNESVRKTLLYDKQGISGRINEANNEITRKWMPEVEKAIRIGMMHAWNAAAWSRIKDYSSGKRWVSGPSSDSPDHPEMNGLIIQAGESFKVPEIHYSGDQRKAINKPTPACEMMYPGDISFSPDPQHLAGCWCRIEAAVYEEPVERKFLSRYSEDSEPGEENENEVI